MSESRLKKKRDWLWYILQGMFTVVLLSSLTSKLSGIGVFSQWEKMQLDVMMLSKRSPLANVIEKVDKNPERAEVYLVEITNQDYKEYFADISPLNRKKVCKLVASVAETHPNQILVDLDLSDSPLVDCFSVSGSSQIADQRKNIKGNYPPMPRIIWAQTLEPTPPSLVCPGGKTRPTGKLAALPKGIDRSDLAVPLFPREPDGQVRSYMLSVPVLNEAGHCEFWPTMVGAANSAKQSGSSEPRGYINFTADPLNIVDAAQFLGPETAHLAQEQAKSLFHGKDATVIIGGAFDAARDTYIIPGRSTPIPGMELIAYAYLSHANGPPIHDATEWVSFVSDIGIGLVIVWLSYIWRGPAALLGCCALTIVFATGVSWFVFGAYSLFLAFIPGAAGAIINYMIDSLRELKAQEESIRDLEEKVEEKDKQIKFLKSIEEDALARPISVNAAVTVVESRGEQASM